MLGFVALLLAAIVVVPPWFGAAWFLASAGALCVALVLVCWWKGEPPRWHWSGDTHGK